MLHHIIELVLPTIISACELIGIFVVTVSAGHAFFEYLKGMVIHKKTNFKLELANGLATGLEFKMAAEILKTVLVHTLDELMILGIVIVLRALLSFMIHFEMRHEEERCRRMDEEGNA